MAKIAFYSVKSYEKDYITTTFNEHEVIILDLPLNEQTVHFSIGCEAVCIFVNDDGSEKVLEKLAEQNIKILLLRCAGFNQVAIETAKKLNIQVARVPEYSPYAIAEHTLALILTLNRKIIRAHNRIMDQNFSLDGLVGFDLHNKTIGVIGTGKIGEKVINILNGFGCKILAYDIHPNPNLTNTTYIDLDTLFNKSDIITLHTPLNEQTKYIINDASIRKMKDNIMIINTGRGGLLDTKAVINGLKHKKIGYLGLDVYEEEKGIFFENHTEDIIQDDVLARLMTFPNVLITSHQAFLTKEALETIVSTTLYNFDSIRLNQSCENLI